MSTRYLDGCTCTRRRCQLEAAVIPVIEQMMEQSTFVEAEKEDAPRLQSGHGGGILRIERKIP